MSPRLFPYISLLSWPRNLGRRAKFIHGSDNRVKARFTYWGGGVFLGSRESSFFSLFFLQGHGTDSGDS